MLKNHFKSSFRYLINHKIFTIINLVGLATGLCVCFFALLYVNFEWSYDRYHKKSDRIYRLVTDVRTSNITTFESTSAPMAPTLKNDFPEVEAATRVFLDNLIIQKDENNFNDEPIAYADSSLFSVFTFPLISGNAATVLNDPYDIVLSETAAKKYFGQENPIGKTLLIDGKFPGAVTGVMQDIPINSHFRVDILVSLSTLIKEWNPEMDKRWNRFGFYTYLLLPENTNPAVLADKLPGFIKEHVDQSGSKYALSLEPLNRVYLYGKARGHRTGTSATGNINHLYIFSIVAVLVLVIAGFNFINLTTAFSLHRAKEIGVLKVLGASRKNLIAKFLADALLLSSIAFIVALLFCILLSPLFNQISGKEIHISDHLNYLSWLALISIGIGLLSGIYPAFFLSGFQPVSTLKGRFISGTKGIHLRKALVVTQFSLSIGLIIATIVVYAQLNFMKTQQLGFKKEHSLVIDFHFDERIIDHVTLVKNQLLKIPGVSSVSISSGVPGKANRITNTKIETAGNNMQEIRLEPYFVDHDFLHQYQINLIAGRSFSKQLTTDSAEAMLINEAAAKSLGYQSPNEAIGKHFEQAGRSGVIIGVVNNFQSHTFKETFQPHTFQIAQGFYTFITLDISSQNLSSTIERLSKTWKTIVPGLPLSYFFADETYNAQYFAEERFGKLFICFASLAIIISCLGLFGLSVFNTQQRTKEIGIRKVLGASIQNIIAILSTDFIKPVVLAFVISSPIAWWAMNKWLQTFAYRIDISWWIFALAGSMALAIALATISFQTLRAAFTNPVKSLKAE